MLQINQLLARFKNLKNTDKVKKEAIAEVFIKNNIPIKIEQLKVSNNTIFIKVQPIIKTEVLLKKEILLNQIKKIIGFANILEIK